MAALSLKNISKEFHGHKVLNSVSFSVEKAEIHALCGENGAGKSTLMKIINGFYPHGDFTGEIFIDDKKQNFRSIRDGEAVGVATIFQELSLVNELSIAENIFLGNEPQKFALIDWNQMLSRTKELLAFVKLQRSPLEKVKKLNVGEQQLVEIAKALSRNARIIILDEPTSALSNSEVNTLMDLLRSLRKRAVTCILISHKLEEVFAIADRITVLRDGKAIATHVSSEVKEKKIIEEMVGRELTALYPYQQRKLGPPVLEIKNWTVFHAQKSKKVLSNINFRLDKGEILGLAGLMGAGRSELLMSIFAAYPGKHSGQIFLNDREINFSSPQDAIEAGLFLVSEDRKRYGLLLDSSVKNNISLSSLKKNNRNGLINAHKELRDINKYIRNFNIRFSNLNVPVRFLSGGNQQKVVLAKCLLTEPQVIFLDEPTRGIDIGAKAEIYTLLMELTKKGVSIVIASSELPEILGLCDRIVVLAQGEMKSEMPREVATQERIMQYAT